ncbi:MAG: hypothetical protein GKR89_22020 [Candidatus Latescibacteria bacterium]|nr:hypothetical protein [Candidatus Latescibacterota bacterium]
MPSHFRRRLLGLALLSAAQVSTAQIAFEDVTQESGIVNPGNAESAWLDYNNDGHLDLITDI